MNSRAKIAAAVLAGTLALGGLTAAILNLGNDQSAHQTGNPRPNAASTPTITPQADPTSPVGTAGPASTPSPSASPVDNSNSTINTGAGSAEAVKRFGKDEFAKAVQFADMFVALAHGDCARLARKVDAKVALTFLYTPETLPKVINDPRRAFLMPDDTEVFPETGCATLDRHTWVATVKGDSDPVLWLQTTTTTILHPSNKPAFAVTQPFSLGLVPMPGTFGWQVNSSRIDKFTISNVKG